MLAGRPWWYFDRLFQLGRCVALNSVHIPPPHMSTFAALSNSVRRPISGEDRAARRQTARRSSTSTSRKRLFGGDSSPPSPVSRWTRVRSCLRAPTDRMPLERAAGPLSRCPSTLGMIPAAIDTYYSSCTRLSAARRAPEVVARSARAWGAFVRVCVIRTFAVTVVHSVLGTP